MLTYGKPKRSKYISPVIQKAKGVPEVINIQTRKIKKINLDIKKADEDVQKVNKHNLP